MRVCSQTNSDVNSVASAAPPRAVVTAAAATAAAGDAAMSSTATAAELKRAKKERAAERKAAAAAASASAAGGNGGDNSGGTTSTTSSTARLAPAGPAYSLKPTDGLTWRQRQAARIAAEEGGETSVAPPLGSPSLIDGASQALASSSSAQEPAAAAVANDAAARPRAGAAASAALVAALADAGAPMGTMRYARGPGEVGADAVARGRHIDPADPANRGFDQRRRRVASAAVANPVASLDVGLPVQTLMG